jgi:DNA end-binding protein Ku
MPRPLWSGSLSFGLVNVPVTLFSAVRDRSVRFSQLHEPDCSPIETHRFCSKENREVPWEEIVKGRELDDGRWVLLTDEDLAAASPHQTRTIDIERFVQESEIDPIYYERPYLLIPGNEGAARAYALLSEVMQDAGRVALGRFVMRAKEHLVSIRPRGRTLTLTTMLFHDEVRSREELAEETSTVKPTSEQIENAVAIVKELEVPFDPSSYKDEHRAHLERVIKRKQKGQKISVPVAEKEPAKETTMAAPDLMGALEESLARIRGDAKQAPAGKPVRKAPAKKASATKASATKASTTKAPRKSPTAGKPSGEKAKQS